MPIERRTSRSQVTTVLIAVFSLVLVASIVYALIQLASGGKGLSFDLGDDRFVAGNAERLARQAADAPILLSDVSGNGQQRPIVLAHSGKDPKKGWVAFDARPPGAPADCIVQVDRGTGELSFAPVDRPRCGDQVFPADGTGFRTYVWSISSDGELVVDLKPKRSTTATTATR